MTMYKAPKLVNVVEDPPPKKSVPLLEPAAPTATTNSHLVPDALVASAPAKEAQRGSSSISAEDQPSAKLQDIKVVVDSKGIGFAAFHINGNAYVWPLYGKTFAKYVRTELAKRGTVPKKNEVLELIEQLSAVAESAAQTVEVWYRIAPHKTGCLIDMGDPGHTRISVTPSGVEVLTRNCPTLFMRTDSCRPYVQPAEVGDLKLLKKYVNVSASDYRLILAYITYTLMHPKQQGTVFPILVLLGEQGSGKTALTRLLLDLLDPSSLSVQIFPTSTKDLVVAMQQGHVRAFDNLRTFTPAMSDVLCIVATGGTLAVRQLYTNGDVNMQSVHGALILNGIAAFVEYPDLAQRCLTIQMEPISDDRRQSEVEMLKQFTLEQPAIFKGILDLCSQILQRLPDAEVTDPARIYEFSRWLTALELVDGVPYGIYQSLYTSMLQEGQMDSLLEHALADALFQFIHDQPDGMWSGRPEELLTKLDLYANQRTKYSQDWPRNAIALSKRLQTLKAGFRSQGVQIDFKRGKYRTITITQDLQNEI